MIRAPFYKDSKAAIRMEHEAPTTLGEGGEWVHLETPQITDCTESKRKLINSNLNGFKINSKADMLHKFTHFSISLHLRPVIKNKIIKTACSFNKC